ncbi:RNA-directed DNA polymerase, eukaryota, reverse transcriptase zinc-binding domain protein [Tanacetum coccineum]
MLKQELADLEMIIDKGDAPYDTLHKRIKVISINLARLGENVLGLYLGEIVDKMGAMKVLRRMESIPELVFRFGGLQLKRTCYGLGLLKLFMAKMGKMVADSRLKKLGNCADTYFWEDLWHGDMVLKQRYPRLYALEVKKTVDVASKLSHENLTWSFRRAPRSGVEQDQLTDLTTYVEGVVLGVTPDRWYWTLDGSGEFSVASARKVIDDNRFPEVSTQTRWIKAVPIKVNIHAWKVRMDCLPTRLNISRRGIDIPSILCPVCGSVTESSSHLFFDCLVAKDNFRKICRWWEVDFMEVHTFDEWVSWIVNLRIPIKHKRLLEGVCFGLWWLIWAYRNKCVFGVVSPSKADIFDDVVSYSFYWSRFRCNVSFSWVDWLKNHHLVTL